MNHHPGVVISKLEGRLGASELESFHEQIQELIHSGCNHLVVDLNGVEHLDSNGIDVLLHCLAQAVRADGDLKLASLSPAAETILAITRATRFFEVFPTVEDAVASFDSVPNVTEVEPWNAFVSADGPDAPETGVAQA
jgi:anti-sigma B factor antagonist